MKIITAEEAGLRAYEPKHGSIEFNTQKYLIPLEEKELEGDFVDLYAFLGMNNPFVILHGMGVDVGDFQKACDYCDPFLGDYELGDEGEWRIKRYHFMAAMPRAILTTNVDQYRRGIFARDMGEKYNFWDIAFDCRWNRKMNGCFKLGQGIPKMLMGSGYPIVGGTMDGSCGAARVAVPLDNGDKVVVWAWEWYNK